MPEEIPVIDLTAYYARGPQHPDAQHAIEAIHAAASTWGFFQIVGTRVSPKTQSSLVSISRSFFDLPLESKNTLDVSSGGVAWRGYMPLGGEHTHGGVDWKEGLYVGPEHCNDHPYFGMPLHGRNQFPDEHLPDMRSIVLNYIGQVTELGKTLTDMFSIGLGLQQDELGQSFKYKPVSSGDSGDGDSFGIGEHTGK
jgi:isopenicillin N synthase-like dioxygenase